MTPIPNVDLEASRGSRGRNGCRTCRRRHLKCDEARPVCHNCAKALRECVWIHKLKIRHDERSSSSKTGLAEATPQKTWRLAANSETDTNSRNLDISVAPGTRSPATWRFCFPPRQLYRQYIGLQRMSGVFGDSGQTGIHDKSITDLLAQPHEAMLFKTYIDYCGPWLDITTPTRQFALTACLAYASKTVSPNTDLYEEYAGFCIAQLIPLLSDDTFIENNDGLLATLVILRHVEQYAKFAQDMGAHLMGAYSLVEIRKEPYRHKSLPCSAFWTFMRQDLRRALLSRSAPLTPARGIPIEDFAPYEELPENAWADRACHLATQAAAFAWGSVHDIDADDLVSQLEDWKRSLPEEYQPYSFNEDAMHFFADWHAVGWQFYHLAKILLDLYNSKCPANMSILTFCSQVEAQILYHVRTICTITYGSTNLGCHFNSTAILGLVGSFLRDEVEQARLIEYLKCLSSETGWPTEDSQSKLLQEWCQSTGSTRCFQVTQSPK